MKGIWFVWYEDKNELRLKEWKYMCDTKYVKWNIADAFKTRKGVKVRSKHK